MNFKVGDKVKVRDWGYSYSTNTYFFTERQNDSDMKIEYMINYAYNNNKFLRYRKLNSDSEIYTVVYINKPRVLIQDSSEAIYLIEDDALELKNKKMTLKEIEE